MMVNQEDEWTLACFVSMRIRIVAVNTWPN
jgi:hypothetical protein